MLDTLSVPSPRSVLPPLSPRMDLSRSLPAACACMHTKTNNLAAVSAPPEARVGARVTNIIASHRHVSPAHLANKYLGLASGAENRK
ncbi:hypothetical protein NDU88_003787 [Pleurodeles waltl]|uniref:Uncharacterized protein n=1 Tax=Pleurodeles waltl TaxID=8319 RepID=A0AAV7W610_PLEWA|nr:hypothetical protein NDU88_003787 [Pleurodeles waltl]